MDQMNRKEELMTDNEEFVKREIHGVQEPTGRLADVIDIVRNRTPMHIPRTIVELLVRYAFIQAYAQLTEDMKQQEIEIIDEVAEAANEICNKYLIQLNTALDAYRKLDNSGSDSNES